MLAPPADADHDLALARRAGNGDLAAFEELVGRHEARLTTLAARLLGSHADAADAVRIVGQSSSEILNILGFSGRTEIVHRDDLVLTGA